ncbi:MAG: ribulose-phosphate 3-epimerase [Pseudomonadota bacterium]
MKGKKKKAKQGIKIAPSILSADFAALGRDVERARRGGADSIHVDVMDGRFVPNLSIGPVVVRHLRAVTKLALDVHLMIVEPERYVEDFAAAGADLIYVHQEACLHLHGVLAALRGLGVRPAVSLNPSTPVSTLEDVLGDLDRVLVMTVNPGFGGQKFIRSMLPKIRRLRRMIDERRLDVEIEVDGGICTVTAPEVVRAGATHLVAGSAVFGKKSVAGAIRDLREAARVG